MTDRTDTPASPTPDMLADPARLDQLIAEGRPFAALAAATRALALQGETHEGLCHLARMETHLGLSLRARRTWRRALQLGSSPAAHGGFGALLIGDGDFTGGIAHLEAALQSAPNDGGLLGALALAHLYRGDAATAQRLAARALIYDPDLMDAALCLVRAHLQLGQLDKAETQLAELVRADVRTDEVRLLQAELWSRSGEHAAALFQLAGLCESHPDSPETLAAFRRAFRAFRDDGAAAQDFADYLAALQIGWDGPIEPFRRSASPRRAEKVDVIIPVHGAQEAVSACLASLRQHGGRRLGRIILVDDASDPQTAAWLQGWVRRNRTARLVTLTERVGFTRAVQKGLEQSDSPAFVLLNSDTLVTEGWLDRLHAALRSDPAIAMVGPLSNAAAWQSYVPTFAPDGGFAAAPTPDAPARLRLCAAARAVAADHLIPMPLLHGFCVMADRRAHDSVGGLDAATYPQGYGETQDLSMRLRAAGLRLCAVADCIVFHDRAGSISGLRRDALSQIGREMLYRSHGALNYLCAEMIAAENPALQPLRDALSRV